MRMNHVFPKKTIIPLIVSILILSWYFIFFAHSLIPLYYILFLGGFGIPFFVYRQSISRRLAQWDIPQPVKFIGLGYAIVLLEESIAALVHALTEGFSLPRFIQLAFQFWDFNLIAFTGFIVGLCFLLTRFRYSTRDIFFIVGIWGLYSEHTLTFLFSNPIIAISLILPTMSTYNLMIAPAVVSLTSMGERELSSWKKYLYSFLVLFLFSLIPILILSVLRSHLPGAFPPCAYISC